MANLLAGQMVLMTETGGMDSVLRVLDTCDATAPNNCIRNLINITESKDVAVGPTQYEFSQTSTQADGTKDTLHCTNWTSAAPVNVSNGDPPCLP